MDKKKEIAGLITGLVAVIAAACYFILGFSLGIWHLAWLVFLAVPVTAIVLDIGTKSRDVSGSIIGLIAVLAAAAFFILGFAFGKWHPGWVVFLVIPFASILFDITKKKDSSSLVGIIALLAVAAFILMGTFLGNWHIAWVVFLAVPIAAIIINIVKVAGRADAQQSQSGDKEQSSSNKRAVKASFFQARICRTV